MRPVGRLHFPFCPGAEHNRSAELRPPPPRKPGGPEGPGRQRPNRPGPLTSGLSRYRMCTTHVPIAVSPEVV
ncbi:unnamed protein product [Protopolystoma xenopodis]|uniref:Uncharacterized protein n=1 Tax=Protopolystoma xenopodis TaxID=117903 RepID=A0A3S5AEJ9_9PLAT|nr:unnamed protein product [Protopolystoma xenopodis]